MWKHCHTWNYTTEKGFVRQTVDPWWAGNSASHPVVSGTYGVFYSPQPMSDEAKWAAPDSPESWCEPEAGINVPALAIFSSPGSIGENIIWTIDDGLEDELFIIRRKCSRALCYKDVSHTDGTISFAPGSPSYILRPCAAGAGDTCNVVDKRWEPFGWSDAIDFSNGYMADETLGPNGPPEHTSSILDFQEDGFTTSDLSKLSVTKISSGFQYSSDHSDNSVGDWRYTWRYIENGQLFDLIIEASFYRYYRYKYDSESAGSGMDKMVPHPDDPGGFAGIYGTCHVLF